MGLKLKVAKATSTTPAAIGRAQHGKVVPRGLRLGGVVKVESKLTKATSTTPAAIGRSRTPQSLRDSKLLPCFRGGAKGGGVQGSNPRAVGVKRRGRPMCLP